MDFLSSSRLSKSKLLFIFEIKDKSDKGFKRDFLSDVFYDFSVWPVNSLRDFWLLRYNNRMRLTNYCYGNGLSLDTLVEMIEFYHEHNDNNRRRLCEIRILWERLAVSNFSQYYYFSMHYGIEIYFDGQIRKNGRPAGPVIDGPFFKSVQYPQPTGLMTCQQYEAEVRRRVEVAEDEKFQTRMKIIEDGQKNNKFKKVLQYLQLSSIDDLFET